MSSIKHVAQERLKDCALALYWGEGAKSLRAGQVDLANCDSALLRLFLRFLREVVGIEERRLRVYLYCFEDQDVEALKEYWSDELRIPLVQFTKPYVRPGNSLSNRKMRFGVAHVRYSDKRLLQFILSGIEELKSWAVTEAVKRDRL